MNVRRRLQHIYRNFDYDNEKETFFIMVVRIWYQFTWSEFNMCILLKAESRMQHWKQVYTQLHYNHRRESIGDAYIFHHHLLCCQYGHVGSLEFVLETKIAIESIEYQQKQNKQVAYIMDDK